MSASQTRVLSTAEARREEVLEAALTVFAQRGLYGTPTLDIARAAGISQAYLFRLFPTKTELFVAIVERSCARVYETFAAAAAQARAAGVDVMCVMGTAYQGLIRDRELLLTQLQGHAAAGEPEVRDALRRGFARLLELVERETGAAPEEIQRFFAMGMLLNVIAAMEADQLPEHWARVLASKGEDGEDLARGAAAAATAGATTDKRGEG